MRPVKSLESECKVTVHAMFLCTADIKHFLLCLLPPCTDGENLRASGPVCITEEWNTIAEGGPEFYPSHMPMPSLDPQPSAASMQQGQQAFAKSWCMQDCNGLQILMARILL